MPETPTAADLAAVRALLERVRAADGTPAVSEQGLIALEPGSGTAHFLAHRAGKLAGYAGLAPHREGHPPMAELAVDPQARRAGVGAGLLSEVLAAGGPDTRVWAHGDLPPARALAAQAGLVPVRTLLRLRRSLAQPLPAPVAAEPEIRPYRGVADDAELLRVNNAAFSWHPEQGGWTSAELAARRAQPWFDPAGLFIAGTDTISGFHWTKAEPGSTIGEVYVVAVDPARQGSGLGSRLTLAGLRYLRDRGLRDVVLYTEADNAAALRTYDKLGFVRDYADVAYAVKS